MALSNHDIIPSLKGQACPHVFSSQPPLPDRQAWPLGAMVVSPAPANVGRGDSSTSTTTTSSGRWSFRRIWHFRSFPSLQRLRKFLKHHGGYDFTFGWQFGEYNITSKWHSSNLYNSMVFTIEIREIPRASTLTLFFSTSFFSLSPQIIKGQELGPDSGTCSSKSTAHSPAWACCDGCQEQ